MEAKVKHTLIHPFEFLGEKFTELEFRTRIKVKDHRRMATARAKANVLAGTQEAREVEAMALFASLAGVPDEVLDEVDLADLDEITSAVFGKKLLGELERMQAASPETKTAS